MQVPKPTEADKARFRSLVPDAPGVEVKPMFGNLGGFVNGNMFMGLFGPEVGVKLAPADLDELRALRGHRTVRPAGATDGGLGHARARPARDARRRGLDRPGAQPRPDAATEEAEGLARPPMPTSTWHARSRLAWPADPRLRDHPGGLRRRARRPGSWPTASPCWQTRATCSPTSPGSGWSWRPSTWPAGQPMPSARSATSGWRSSPRWSTRCCCSGWPASSCSRPGGGWPSRSPSAQRPHVRVGILGLVANGGLAVPAP